MKNIIIFFATISLGLSSYSQTKFATIKENKIIIQIDTIKFKEFIYKNLYQGNMKANLQKIEVRKQNILGTKKEFYFVTIGDLKKHIKIVKWLSKEDDNLILKNDIESEDLFESYYVICTGIKDCQPNVIELDGKRNWVCGESMTCSSKKLPKAERCEKTTIVTETNF